MEELNEFGEATECQPDVEPEGDENEFEDTGDSVEETLEDVVSETEIREIENNFEELKDEKSEAIDQSFDDQSGGIVETLEDFWADIYTEPMAESETFSKDAIETLQHIEHFTPSAIEHIFEGQLNFRGDAVGYHYNQIEETAGRIIEGSQTEPNEFGVYTAQVEVSGVEKTANDGKSTMFPDACSPQEVVDMINQAYDNREYVEGTRNTFVGTAENGMEISMFINRNDEIISAFPKER